MAFLCRQPLGRVRDRSGRKSIRVAAGRWSFSRGGEGRLLVCFTIERSVRICAGWLHRRARFRVCGFRVGCQSRTHPYIPGTPKTYRRADATLTPEAAIQGAVLNRFRDMAHGDGRLSIEVRDGAGDFQYPIVRTRAQALLLHRSFQEAFGFRRELTVGADLASMHLRIGEDTVAGETLVLPLPRREHTRPDFIRSFARCARTKLPVLHRRNLDVDINAIQKRT